MNKGFKLGPRGGVAKKLAYKPQEPGYWFFGKCYNCGSEAFSFTRATRHICAEKELFTIFKPVTNGEKLFMGNSTTSFVEGKVGLMLTLGKELTLNKVLYVPNIC